MALKDLRSCLYECRIMHHRLAPVQNRFVYPSFFFLLDLDELDDVRRRLFLFSRGGRNVFSYRESDHLRYGALSTKESVLRHLLDNGVDAAVDRIVLLTNLRTMGHVFNPVSFYFCYGAADAPVAVLAEVGNTFGEMKPYLLTRRPKAAGVFEESHAKYFYVSPFMRLDSGFDFRLEAPGEVLNLRIDGLEGGEKILVTSVRGERQPLTNAKLFRYALRFPFLTLRILALIHYQALRLYRKGVPFYRKNSHQHLQREVFHAHHQ
jgi:DUF1365 family protein